MEYEDVHGDTGRIKTHRIRPSDWTWNKDPIVTAAPAWKRKKAELEKLLSEGLGERYIVDEVAVMFDSFAEDNLNAFIKEAVAEPGVKLFNSAWDHVETHPIPSEYWVEYNFLEVEDLGMRVEVMRIDRGISPLHESLAAGVYNPTVQGMETTGPKVVHFSFKVPNLEEYNKVCYRLREELGAVQVQGCTSDYGRFGYYRVSEFGHNTYIKPRVNLRDPATLEPMPNTASSDRGEFGMPTVGRRIQDVPQA